jgi:hypothetical protein
VLTFRPITLAQTEGQLIFATSASTGPETLTVAGSGYSGPLATFRKGQVNFGVVDIGLFKDDTVFIVNSGNEVLTLPGHNVYPAEFTLVRIPPYQTSLGDSTQAIIRFAPAAAVTYSGKYIQAWGWVATLDTVYLRGTGKIPPPRLTTNQSRYEFGTIFLGAHRDSLIMVRNFGADTLRMYSVNSTSGQFHVVTFPENIAPGGEGALSLRFIPEKVANYLGDVVITSNSPGSPDTLVLSASCISTKGIRAIEGTPTESFLTQNYPNPFNPTTTFRFALAEASRVQLSVYNSLGQRTGELFDDQLPAGVFEFDWNATGLASGAYFYRLQAGRFVDIKKLLLLR